MSYQEFENNVQETLRGVENLLLTKGREYSRNDNPIHNFERGCRITGEKPELILDGFLLKHYISYRDILDDIKKGKYPEKEVVNEKLGDIITYFVIQKAIMLRSLEQ